MNGKTSGLLRKHCKKEAVFIDAWCPGKGERRVPEEGLLPGEISAVIFQVGCYTVRSALRVYTVLNTDGYFGEAGEPAGKEDVEIVRKDRAGSIPSWRDKLRITHEISARHNSSPDKSFTYICHAAGILCVHIRFLRC